MRTRYPRLPQGWVVLLVVVLLTATDQLIKIAVKMTMTIGQHHDIASWCQIYFIENSGMAYGITLGSKLFLTLFRIVAMGLAICFTVFLVKKRLYKTTFLISLALIISGGLGNIIDSVFYGVVFSESNTYTVATLFPPEGGYAPVFHGKVVDMFYFPLIRGQFPNWIPFWGGEGFEFFRPVFNFADACISVGVAIMLLVFPRTASHALNTLDTALGRNKDKNAASGKQEAEKADLKAQRQNSFIQKH